MKAKKLVALLLAVLLLAAMLTACSTEEPLPDSSDGGDTPSDSGDDGGDGGDSGEIREINFWWTDNGNSSGGASSKIDLVEAQINEIAERELGIHVNMNWVTSADYGTQLALAIANGEQVDLAVYQFYDAISFVGQFSNGQMLPLDDLVDEHAPELRDMFGDILKGSTVDGKLYGIPTYRVLNSDMYWCAREDVLEAAGVLEEAQNIQTWEDIEAIFAAIRDSAGAGTYAVGGNKYLTYGNGGFMAGGSGSDNIFENAIGYDTLGDTLKLIYSDQEGNVMNGYEHEAALESFRRNKTWLDAGYMYPESAFTTESIEVLITQGVVGTYFVTSEYGVETTKTQQIGTDMLCVNMTEGKGLLGTDGARRIGCYIPVTAKEPEAAMEFIGLMYSNSELMNTLIWGVEGETYVVNEEGEAAYPPGTDTTTCGYHSYDFMLGNAFLCLPWDGSGGDFRERALENFQAAPISKYMGISVDTGSHGTLVSSLVAVQEEYGGQIDCGQYTDELYAEFLEKLDAAGIDEYVALYQTAVDEFIQ